MQFTNEEIQAANRLCTYLRSHMSANLHGVGLKKHEYFTDMTQLVVFVHRKKYMGSIEIPREWEGIQVWVEAVGKFIPA